MVFMIIMYVLYIQWYNVAIISDATVKLIILLLN